MDILTLAFLAIALLVAQMTKKRERSRSNVPIALIT